jgi:hypothetical protein
VHFEIAGVGAPTAGAGDVLRLLCHLLYSGKMILIL